MKSSRGILRHRELLGAAHIIPDSDPDGHPEVSNGLSLCKIHRAAFDRGIIGIRPDYADASLVVPVAPELAPVRGVPAASGNTPSGGFLSGLANFVGELAQAQYNPVAAMEVTQTADHALAAVPTWFSNQEQAVSEAASSADTSTLGGKVLAGFSAADYAVLKATGAAVGGVTQLARSFTNLDVVKQNLEGLGTLLAAGSGDPVAQMQITTAIAQMPTEDKLANLAGILATGGEGITTATEAGLSKFSNLVDLTPSADGSTSSLALQAGRIGASPIDAAVADQAKIGYNVDKWSGQYLRKGDVVYKLSPGDSSYFTDINTVQASNFDSFSLSRSLQIKPHDVYGYRPDITGYKLTQAIYVPNSPALANPSFGPGGGTQYFIQNYDKYLTPITTIDLSTPGNMYLDSTTPFLNGGH